MNFKPIGRQPHGSHNTICPVLYPHAVGNVTNWVTAAVDMLDLMNRLEIDFRNFA